MGYGNPYLLVNTHTELLLVNQHTDIFENFPKKSISVVINFSSSHFLDKQDDMNVDMRLNPLHTGRGPLKRRKYECNSEYLEWGHGNFDLSKSESQSSLSSLALFSSSLVSSSTTSSAPADSAAQRLETMSQDDFRHNVLALVAQCAGCEGEHPYEPFVNEFACDFRTTSGKSNNKRYSDRYWWQAVLHVDKRRHELQGVDLVKAITKKIINWTIQENNQRDIIAKFLFK